MRRKHFQQRGSQKRKDIQETKESRPFNIAAEDEEEEEEDRSARGANPNLLDHSLKKTLQRQNVISVTADVNYPRNNSTSTSDTETNAKSPCLGGPDKRRKRATLSRPEREEINGNFLFLKTLTYSQETDFSDLSEPATSRIEGGGGGVGGRGSGMDHHKNLSIDEEPEPTEEPFVEILDEVVPGSPALHHRGRGRKLKDEYQLVTFV